MPKKPSSEKKIESFVHDDASRRNIPPAEYQTMVRNQEKTPLQVAYERRNPDLDPQLIWRGKDLLDDSPLVVNAPPLYIQEKIHPKVLIDDLKRRSKQEGSGDAEQIDLFSAFNGLPSEEAKTEFYQHDQNWSNRMILGDSLQVMASLAEREGLRGKVQCIYFDPPYGIKFNSNFQWSTKNRDVKDGRADQITREPEQVKAFRDTWKDGTHSYLTYLQERLTIARDLLTSTGSIFVQIGEENIHRARALMDEVFGEKNFVASINYVTTSGFPTTTLTRAGDSIIWYARDKAKIKYRQLFESKAAGDSGAAEYKWIMTEDGCIRSLTEEEYRGSKPLPPNARRWRFGPLTSSGASEKGTVDFYFQNRRFHPGKGNHWKVKSDGLERLAKSGLMIARKKSLAYYLFAENYPIQPITNIWQDTKWGFNANDKSYVVQTNTKVIQKCILMTTDPGDLVLDPTCGSGTTPYAAEQWGRRWIAIDTSRVALALARTRIMGSRYPFYLLSDSFEGKTKEAEISGLPKASENTSNNLREGFVYEKVPHITLGSIANNIEIDTIYEKWQKTLSPLLIQINAEIDAILNAWDIPREADPKWSQKAKDLHKEWHNANINYRKEVDDSISSKADFEILYDKPFVDNSKVRCAGPFTIESLSPHRTMIVNHDDTLIDPHQQGAKSQGTTDFAQMILDTLRVAGVQQTHKEDRINFESLDGWPGNYIGGKGSYRDTDAKLKTAGIFIGPEFGTVSRVDLVEAARECADAGFDVLISCAFNYEAQSTEFDKLGPLPVLKARMNSDLHMQPDLKNTGKGNLFVIFGEPDIDILDVPDNNIQVKINGVDVFDPSSGEVRSNEPDTIACWFIDNDYNGESFFVRQAYFLGQEDPYKSLKTALKAEIDADAWESLNSDTSVPFAKPQTGRIAVKVINHLGDEVMKVYRVA